jgi:hypothetical protein
MAFYPIEDQFNSSSFNPAFLTSRSQFTFSIFPLSGVNLGYNEQKVISSVTSNLFSGTDQNSAFLGLAKSMIKRSTFNQKLETDFLNFTYRSAVGFFDFRIRENASITTSLKGPVSGFMLDPEVREVEVGRIQNIPVLILHYREYSIGYSSPSEQQAVSWGIRGKLYYGKGVFTSEISGKITESNGDYFLSTSGKGKVLLPQATSTTQGVSGSSAVNYMMNSGNTGIGFDFGLKFKIDSRLSFTASVLDLGNIKWNNKQNILVSKDFTGQYELEASKLNPSKVENGIVSISKISDNITFEEGLINKPQIVDDKQLPFSTTLPVTFYTGMSYQLNPKIKLSLVDRFIRISKMNSNSIAASVNYDVNKKITISTGYSIIGDTYVNFPLAFLYRGDFGQFYMGTDNFLSFLVPSITNFSGITFGTCFYVFRNRNLYGNPDERTPFHKPKKVRKVFNNGRILNKKSEFGFPEQY